MERENMISKDLVAASAKPLILSVLKEDENYGYAIIQRVKEISGGELQWKDGMLYPVLHRLEKQGLIESYWQTADNGRKRKYYRLRPQGKTALAAERRQWEAVNATLVRLWEGRVSWV